MSEQKPRNAYYLNPLTSDDFNHTINDLKINNAPLKKINEITNAYKETSLHEKKQKKLANDGNTYNLIKKPKNNDY